jgi:hypothetical protein
MTLGIWFLTSFTVFSGWATSFYPTPFSDKVRNAPHVVRGTAGSSQADWSVGGDGSRRIYTYTDLKVEEVIKGAQISNGSSILMRELGGEKDGLGMRVAGTAEFKQGEDTVVFLGNKNPDGSYDVFGMMTGKFNVRRDDQGEEVLTGGGLSPWGQWEGLVQHDTGPLKKDRGKWTLNRLRDLVKEQIAVEPQAQQPKTIDQSPVSPDPQKPTASPLQNKAEESTIDGPTQGQSRSPRGMILAVGVGLGFALWGIRMVTRKKS